MKLGNSVITCKVLAIILENYNKWILNSRIFQARNLEQLTRRETLFAETINKIDFNTKEALDDFNRHFSASLQKTQETFEHIISEIDDTLRTQQEKLKTALDNQNVLIIQSIDYQQKALEMKLQDATKLVDELNKIGDKIASITRLETNNERSE
jgi:predicted phage-related endonuclease